MNDLEPALLAALLRPEAYPHPATAIEHIEIKRGVASISLSGNFERAETMGEFFDNVVLGVAVMFILVVLLVLWMTL